MTDNLCDLCFKIQLLDISILGVKIVVILSGQRVNLKMQVSLEDYCLSLFFSVHCIAHIKWCAKLICHVYFLYNFKVESLGFELKCGIWTLTAVIDNIIYSMIYLTIFHFFNTVEPAMSSHSYEQPTSYGRPLGHSQNDILYTNEPPMSSHLS